MSWVSSADVCSTGDSRVCSGFTRGEGLRDSAPTGACPGWLGPGRPWSGKCCCTQQCRKWWCAGVCHFSQLEEGPCTQGSRLRKLSFWSLRWPRQGQEVEHVTLPHLKRPNSALAHGPPFSSSNSHTSEVLSGPLLHHPSQATLTSQSAYCMPTLTTMTETKHLW